MFDHKQIYLYVLYTTYVLYFMSYIGFYSLAPQYIQLLDEILKIYVGLFLVIKFNPIFKHKFDSFDKDIAFSSGIIILLSTTFTTIISKYISQY